MEVNGYLHPLTALPLRNDPWYPLNRRLETEKSSLNKSDSVLPDQDNSTFNRVNVMAIKNYRKVQYLLYKNTRYQLK
jgi:hypothetical protein